jgi:PilZ domain-containing protein
MSQNRRHPRYLTLRTGKIEFQDQLVDCAILNVSASGACLLVPNAADLPGSFELAIDGTRGLTRCRVAWRDTHKVGVRFVEYAVQPPARRRGHGGS